MFAGVVEAGELTPYDYSSCDDLPNTCAMTSAAVVMRIKMVEIAAMVGSIWSRRARNMLRVMVDMSPPEMNSATMTSSNDTMNASSAPVMTEKRICGRVMSINARSLDAPRLRATRS